MAGLAKGVGVRIQGLKSVVERLTAAGGPAMIPRVKAVMTEGATVFEKAVEDEARRRSSGRSHRFKWKRENIDVLLAAYSLVTATRSAPSRVMDRAGAWAGTTIKLAPHAYMIEFGTSRSKPRPFFRNAVESAKGPAKAVIVAGLNDLMDETFGPQWSLPK